MMDTKNNISDKRIEELASNIAKPIFNQMKKLIIKNTKHLRENKGVNLNHVIKMVLLALSSIDDNIIHMLKRAEYIESGKIDFNKVLETYLRAFISTLNEEEVLFVKEKVFNGK